MSNWRKRSLLWWLISCFHINFMSSYWFLNSNWMCFFLFLVKILFLCSAEMRKKQICCQVIKLLKMWRITQHYFDLSSRRKIYPLKWNLNYLSNILPVLWTFIHFDFQPSQTFSFLYYIASKKQQETTRPSCWLLSNF